MPVGNVLTPQEIIDRINAAGGLAILAHPAWSLMEPGEMMDMKGIVAAEVYNSVSGAPWNANRADSSHYFDLWASKGKLVPCVASDDSHWYAGEQAKGVHHGAGRRADCGRNYGSTEKWQVLCQLWPQIFPDFL